MNLRDLVQIKDYSPDIKIRLLTIIQQCNWVEELFDLISELDQSERESSGLVQTLEHDFAQAVEACKRLEAEVDDTKSDVRRALAIQKRATVNGVEIPIDN